MNKNMKSKMNRNLSSKFPRISIGLCVLALAAGLTAQGAAPVITSFSGNGVLVCSNLAPGSVAAVEWASSVTGPWTNTWAGLEAVTVDTNGLIQVSVPMFYRVRGIPAPPPGMVLIPAGSFTMGNCMNPSEGYSDELPLHPVYVSAFYMDRYAVTKALWDEVKGWNGGNGYVYENAGAGKAANHPVQMVNWRDCVKWCNARSQKEGLVPCYYNEEGLATVYKSGTGTPYPKWAANGYRLPTEAEWEKAARGGVSGHRFPWADTDTITHSRANYYAYPSGHSYDVNPTEGYHPSFATGGGPYTSPVGYFEANGYGLYDMAGNVLEWCWDWYSSGYYSSSPGTDPRGPTSGSNRVNRGGSWYGNAYNCRSAYRGHYTPGNRYYDFGFRAVRPPGQ